MLSAKIPNDVRRAVYRRDGYACALCSDPRTLQVHHFVPRSRGGTNSMHNLITLCSFCHALAHGIVLREVEMPAEEVHQAIGEYLADYYMPDWEMAGKWEP